MIQRADSATPPNERHDVYLPTHTGIGYHLSLSDSQNLLILPFFGIRLYKKTKGSRDLCYNNSAVLEIVNPITQLAHNQLDVFLQFVKSNLFTLYFVFLMIMTYE